MLDQSGEEREHPKPARPGGQGQREEQEVTVAKDCGSKLSRWRKVQDSAGSAQPLHGDTLASLLGGGGSQGEFQSGGCSGACGAGTSCS